MEKERKHTTAKHTKASNRIVLLKLIVLTSFIFMLFTSIPTLNSVYGESEVYWEVTFDTYPRTTHIIVDGITYLPHQQPVTFNWLNGTNHEFKIGENITKIDLGRQYRFEKWNDGYTVGDTRTINATKDMNYFAILKTQYYLTIESAYGNPEGEGWHDEGSTVPIRIETLIEVIPEQVRRHFEDWDKGLNPRSNENSLTLFNPTTVIARWKTQYLLEVTSEIGRVKVSGSGWYDEGSNAYISTNSEYIVKPGEHKYDFNRWVFFGVNQPIIDQQGYSSTTITMNDHYRVTATWNEMWHLKITSDPPDLITGTDSEWYQTGSEVTVERASNKISGYKFLGWQVDGKPVSENPFTLQIDQSHLAEAKYAKYYSIILDVYPRVSPIIIDGLIYLPTSLPMTFEWTEGSEHTFGLPSISVAGPIGTRYLFTEWNDLQNNESRQITVDKDAVYTAMLTIQYYLTIVSQHGSPVGEGWYDSGSIAFFAIEPLVNQIANKSRQVFLGWDHGQTRWNPSNSIDIVGPTLMKAEWKTQYYLNVTTSVEGITVKGVGWYDEGSSAKISTLDEYEIERNRHKYTFMRWSNIQQIVAIENPQETVTTVLMDDAYDIQATWNEWFYLVIDSVYGDPEGEGYYLNGTTAIVSVFSPSVVESYKSRVVFTGWSGQLGLNDARLSVLIDSPKTLKAEWKKQYYMTIVSAVPNFQGAGWYNEGSIATVRVVESISTGIGRQTVFQNWRGDLQSDEIEVTIKMESSHIVYANWTTDSSILNIIFALMMGSVLVTIPFVGFKISNKKKEGINMRLIQLLEGINIVLMKLLEGISLVLMKLLKNLKSIKRR